ncbi:capsule biosynthesis protein [Serratia phage vB_SspM_LC53]|nr:capsule biosynthesis protein [Serratia phage vB_SspM_LC53]
MKLTIDIDDTITFWNNDRDYVNFKPDTVMVSMINKLYDEGHEITLYTARGMKSVGPGRIASEIVPSLIENLKRIGLKYHNLLTHKPVYDWIIDDKAMRPDEFKNLMNKGEFQTFKSYKPNL